MSYGTIFHFVEENIKIVTIEFPLERSCDCFEVQLKSQQLLLNRFKRGKVIGDNGFALQDRKVNLDVI
jgi:hypothetical protein